MPIGSPASSPAMCGITRLRPTSSQVSLSRCIAPFAGLGRATVAQEPPRPAVPIRRSVQQDYMVCLECGFRAQALRRHLRVGHGLGLDDYRARWNLPTDYPSAAPSYLGATLEDGQGARSRAQTRYRHVAPTDRRSPPQAAYRA